MKVTMKVKPDKEDEEVDLDEGMAVEDTLDAMPMDVTKPGDDEGMDGYADGNVPEESAAEETAEAPSLADVVPEANPDVEGRIQALENRLESMRQEPATEAAAPGEPGDGQRAMEMGGGTSDWAQFETDYPDIAAPIKALLDARTQTRNTEMAAVHARIFEEAMDAARPDWRDLRDNPAFGEWLKSHPEQQTAAQVPGVRAALGVLNAFDASQQGGDVVKQRQERLQRSAATPTKGSRSTNLSDTLDGWAAA